jgi:putative inorganic carbon (hco3(-)) transporter
MIREILSPEKRFSTHIFSVLLGILNGTVILAAIFTNHLFALVLVLAALVAFVGIMLGRFKQLLISVILFDILFQVHIHFRYRESAAEMSALPGVIISLSTLILGILYFFWLVELLAGAARLSGQLLRFSLPTLGYFLLLSFSVVYARDTELAVFEVVLLLQSLLLFFYIFHAVRSREDVLFILTTFMLILAANSLVMIGVRLVGQDIELGPIFAGIDAFGRVGGTMGSPNTAASLLTMLLAPVLGLYLARVSWWSKVLAVIAFLLGTIALILTFSRGGWLGFGVSMGIFFYLAWRRGLLGLAIPVSTVGLALISLFFTRETILGRIIDDQGAAYSRIPLNRIALAMIQDHPSFGVGANNFAVIVPDYVTPDFSNEWIQTVHNKYLLVWSELGLVGLIAFLSFLFYTLQLGYQLWKINDPLLSPIALGFSAALSGFMVHMLFDLFTRRPQIQIMWFTAALLAAMTVIVQKKANRASNQPHQAEPLPAALQKPVQPQQDLSP